MNADLLSILVCPETKQPLTLLGDNELTRLNNLVQDGRILNRGGVVVTKQLESALLRSDGLFLYPVTDGIPVMLIEEAIATKQLN